MTILTRVGEWLGGPLPLISKPAREIHHVDGATYSIELTWWWRCLRFEYHTPRHPRDVRRIRAAESVHLAEMLRRRDAGEPHVQVGDIIPAHRGHIPVDVLEFRDCEGDLWRRAVGDERFTEEDLRLPVELRQVYDWVHPSRCDGEIAGHSTDEGRLYYAPLIVTKVAETASR